MSVRSNRARWFGARMGGSGVSPPILQVGVKPGQYEPGFVIFP